MLWLRSILPLSPIMYSCSAASGLFVWYASISLLTFGRRFARLRESWSCDLSRVSSRRCSWRTSRCRERLFCFVAEAVRVASESRRRESCAIRESRWMGLGFVLLNRQVDIPSLRCPAVSIPSASHLLMASEVCLGQMRTASRYGTAFLSWSSVSPSGPSMHALRGYIPVSLMIAPVAEAEPSRSL